MSKWSAYPDEYKQTKDESVYVVPERRGDINYEPKSLVSREKELLDKDKQQEYEEPDFECSGLLEKDEQVDKNLDRKFVRPLDARKPTEIGWRLFIFKGDETVDKESKLIKLYKGDHFIFGKDRRICHITLMHQSISREHAAICFRQVDDDDIRPYIIDLRSANGTRVCGKLISPMEFHELKISDIINFGFSLRDYVLMKDEVTDIHSLRFKDGDELPSGYL
eukprot:GHVH01000778.1.p1 GENE.GHVH01000778.1~~GHVH01000778.1.p1  ORF type:complete len:222 (+),score=36.57 GHVH01000778.1:148-813(+)